MSEAISRTQPDHLRVGVFGVGQMGRPIVDRLAAGGHAPTVYVRRPELRAELEAAGVEVTDSPAELAGAVDVLIVCMFSDAQLREAVIDGGVLAAMQPGAVLVNHVTGSPALAGELAELAPEGVHVLDAPMSGTADQIRAGTLTLLVGGAAGDLERARPALAAYAEPIIHLGQLGDGQRMKLVNNLLFAVHLRAALEATSIAGKMGIAAADLARVLQHCSADSFALRLMQQVPPEAMRASAVPFLRKDVAVIRQVAESMHADLGLLGELARWVDDA